MTGITTEDLEILRSRWRRAREPLGLVDPADQGFATGGLGRFVPQLGARLLILPGDPEAAVIHFDRTFGEWWEKAWPDPLTGQRLAWGSHRRQFADAAVRYRSSGQGGQWARYIAAHRHGGFEMGLGREAGSKEVAPRVVNLRQVVGRVWQALHICGLLVAEFKPQGPWEVSLALPNTRGAVLGGLATGWEEEVEPRASEDTALLTRRELTAWPDENGAEDLAFRLGEWIENAWGSRRRRFLILDSGNLTDVFDGGRFHQDGE